MSQAKKLVHHASLYAVGNVSRQLVGFVMLPVYTQFLSPADYGAIGLITFLLAIAEGLLGMRLGMAVPKYYYETDDASYRRKVLSSALIITGFASTIVTAALFFSAGPLSDLLFADRSYSTALAVFSLVFILQALEAYGLLYLRIQERAGLFLAINLIKLAFQLSLNILFVVVLEMGVLGIALSLVISTLIMAIALSIYLIRSVGLSFDRSIGTKLIRFAWPLWLAGIAGLYTNAADHYFIRLFDSLDGVGLYSLAGKVALVLMLLLWEPFNQFWITERFNIHYRGEGTAVFPAVFEAMFGVMLIASLGLSLFGAPLIRLMADPSYHGAVAAIPWLCLTKLMYSAILYFRFSFLVTENTRWISRASYFSVVVSTAFYVALIPKFGFTGAAIGLFLATTLQFVLEYFLGRRCYDMNVRPGALMAVIALCYGLLFLSEAINPTTGFWSDLVWRGLAWMALSVIPLAYMLRQPKTRRTIMDAIAEIRGKLRRKTT